MTFSKRHLTKLIARVDGSRRSITEPAMPINFDKARKLINELEAKLNHTSSRTAAASEALHKWIESGEAGLRKKGALALKEVRKRADSFTDALTKLEQNIAASLDKMSDSLEKNGTKKSSKKTSKKTSKKPSSKAPSKKPASAVKKAVKAASPSAKKTALPKAASKKKVVARKVA